MSALGRFAIALGAGVVVMTALGVAIALSYHPVRPRIVCAMPLGTGGYLVHFGYTNEAKETVHEPRGRSNRVEPAGEPPTEFRPGSSGSYPNAAFVVTAKRGEDVAWTLGPRTVRLDEETLRCPSPTAPKLPEELALVLPKPPPVAPTPKPEPPPLVEKIAPELAEPPPPPPRPVVKSRPKEKVKEIISDRPVTLALESLSKVDSGGMAILSAEEDSLGDAAIGRLLEGSDDAVGGVVGGVAGGTGPVSDIPPSRSPKRTAAKVKVRPKGEWPADAPPRAGSVLVRLSLLVGKDGKVKEVKVIRGAGPAFDREARAVGFRAVFTPATVDDEPVESWVPWDVEFAPDDF